MLSYALLLELSLTAVHMVLTLEPHMKMLSQNLETTRYHMMMTMTTGVALTAETTPLSAGILFIC